MKKTNEKESKLIFIDGPKTKARERRETRVRTEPINTKTKKIIVGEAVVIRNLMLWPCAATNAIWRRSEAEAKEKTCYYLMISHTKVMKSECCEQQQRKKKWWKKLNEVLLALLHSYWYESFVVVYCMLGECSTRFAFFRFHSFLRLTLLLILITKSVTQLQTSTAIDTLKS